MTSAAGLQILDIVDGGSANNGEDVFLKIKVNNGKTTQDVAFFIADDKLAMMLQLLVHFGSMARNVRLKRDPAAEADQKYAGAHAFNLGSAHYGRVVGDANKAIITLQADASQGRLLNFFLAADRSALAKLQTVCEAAIRELDSPDPAPSKSKLN